jgi:anti-anti-sigma regulatory factor
VEIESLASSRKIANMPIKITEIEMRDQDSDSSAVSADYPIDQVDASDTAVTKPKTFKVEGALHLKDAELLESICREVSAQPGSSLIVDLTDICFLDQASAEVLCRMKRQQGIQIRGMNLFIKKVMELVST